MGDIIFEAVFHIWILSYSCRKSSTNTDCYNIIVYTGTIDKTQLHHTTSTVDIDAFSGMSEAPTAVV